MRQSGRISLLALVVIVGLVLVGFILLFGQESLTSVGARFMTALAKGDVDTLTKMSSLGDEPEDQIRKQWVFACNTAGKHYAFLWRITSSMEQERDKIGSVQMQVTRNAMSPGGYDEGFQLPLIKKDGQWKVDVGSISRQMYPALPH